MRGIVEYPFRYRFVNPNGRAKGVLPLNGRVTTEGLVLRNETIFFDDIYKAELIGKLLVLVLKPYPTIGRVTARNIFPNHNSLVLRVTNPFNIRATIDNRRAMLEIEQRKATMTREEIKRYFKKINCPSCHSPIDITDILPTRYIQCPFCTGIVNKYGTSLPGVVTYGICPETGYYDKLDYYYDVQFYYTGKERELYQRKRYCGAGYAEYQFRQHFLKNLTLLYGAVVMLRNKWKIFRYSNPEYEGLHKGNALAMQNKMLEAHHIFFKILTHYPEHPGIHLNYGLAFLRNGDKGKAMKHFQKSLSGCSNYIPTLRLLRKLEEKERLEKEGSETM